MKIKYAEIGICGLSCLLCPRYHADGKSRCPGCKSEFRMSAGCPFITCAVKKKGVEFCRDCAESATCEKWRKHRELGKRSDSFKCYRKLEDDIAFINENGVDEFVKAQKIRERLLVKMLREFNEGRSKSYYCIAATVLEIGELKDAVQKAVKDSGGLELKAKSGTLHRILDEIAMRKNYRLELRK